MAVDLILICRKEKRGHKRKSSVYHGALRLRGIGALCSGIIREGCAELGRDGGPAMSGQRGEALSL